MNAHAKDQIVVNSCKSEIFSDLFSAVRKLLDGWNFAGIVSALTAADSISTNHQQLLL